MRIKEGKVKYEKALAHDNKENHKHVIKTASEKFKTANNNSMEKPNWLEIKKQKKELKEKYKTKRLNNIYDITNMAKQIGEKLRRSDCTKVERKKLISKWMLKYCDPEIQQAIYQELQPSLVFMIQSKYAKNCVKTMLKYGSQEMKHKIVSSCYDRAEIIVMLRDSVVELSQTKLGSKVAALCIWHGTNKDRKFIMKALKDNVKTVSISEHGYLILLALFDSVDDIVLMKKIILLEVERDLTDIAVNDNGKHVILYLVARRNSHYFPPSIVKFLEQGDNNATSKKPANIREKELLDSIYDSLIQTITLNTTIWMSNSSIAMVTLAILKIGTGKKLKKAFKSVVKFITNSESKIKEGNCEYIPVEHAGLHMMLKKLIQNDKELQEKNEINVQIEDYSRYIII
ncbi:PREDICTED: pumilio homolog 3 [Habropoda laboriosa]|uniref:pumilio homolog 3 n=1 Tax=Habropoda laboriosa TaxID=597456 RepID=UPI00083E6199|nr:PREDICTED: pumilio homolog 3 [Habropoda laboriosa]